MNSSFLQKIISPALAGAAAALTIIFTFSHLSYFSILVGIVSYVIFLWFFQMVVDVLGDLADGRVGKGILFGLVFSVVIVIIGKVFSTLEVSTNLQYIPGFFVSAPIFLIPGIRSASEFAMIITYAFYCMGVGGLLGAASSLKQPKAVIGIVLMLGILGFAHYHTLTQIQESLSALVNAIAQIFSGEVIVEGN